MPLTVSHPAAIAPILGLGMPTSALVIGSMAPDLPYYLPIPVDPAASHSLAGVLGVDLMVGLCAYLVWHLVLVQPLLWMAPEALQQRVPQADPRAPLSSAGQLARVGLGLAVGSLTHVAADAFTHEHTVGPHILPWLTQSVLGHPIFLWLQAGASVVGLGIIAALLMRWWSRTPPTGRTSGVPAGVRWSIFGALAGWAAYSTLQLAVTRVMAPGRVNREQLLTGSLIEFLSTLLHGILVAAVVWHVAHAIKAAVERVEARP